MSFLAPAALALGFLAIPIILLYMLRLRRREQLISSTLLWREVVRDRSANAPWQRLRRNLLLLLQLLILAALVFALAQPYIRSPVHIDGSMIVLLDASASMTATDGEEGTTRFALAVEETSRLINELDGEDMMTLIIVGRAPVVAAAATNDKSLLRRALGSYSPDLSSADWSSAIAMASGLSQGIQEPQIVIISDGGLSAGLPPVTGEVIFLPVGRSGDNLAISTIGGRPSGSEIDLLVSVANYGQTTGQALLSLYADNKLIDSRNVEVAPDEIAPISWRIPNDVGILEAKLAATGKSADYLAVDDRAWSIASGRSKRNVLLVSSGNLFLERVLAVLPGYEVTRLIPDEAFTFEDDNPYDIYVFDGTAIPDPLPAGNILIFDPQPSAVSTGALPELQVGAIFTDTAVTRIADDLLLRNVDWRDVSIAEAKTVSGGGLSPLIDSMGGPLLMAGELDGRRIVVFPFDLAASDLPLQIAFPVILANITEWLAPGGISAAQEFYQPGAVVTLLPNPRAGSALVELPNGETWETSSPGRSEPILFAATTQPGIYTISYFDTAGVLIGTDQFAVNFFMPDESSIIPVNLLRLGQIEVTPTDEQNTGRLELWSYILGIGLILILLEWWIAYHQGSKRLLVKSR